MNDSNEKQSGCASGCSRCELNLGAVSPVGSLHGWRLSVAAAAVFVLPFILAIAGASLGGGGKTGQFVGAIAGLGVGVAAVIVIAALRRRRRKRLNPPCPTAEPADEEKP